MVESFFLTKRKIKKNEDILICYADIVLDNKILKKINSKNSFVFLNKNWLSVWKKRMSFKKIIKDAENVTTRKNKIITIGTKIKDKLPQYQFMGIIKLNYKDFLVLFNFYKKINNKKIDFTNFLNLAIENNKIDLYYKPISVNWFEIDSYKDLRIAKQKF